MNDNNSIVEEMDSNPQVPEVRVDKVTIFEQLESAFSKYMQNSISKDTFFKLIEDNLTALSRSYFDTEKGFQLDIVESKSDKEPFFGIRIIPFYKALQSMTNEFASIRPSSLDRVRSKWNSLRDFVVELDSQIFDRTFIAFNPKELTALLLNAFGKIVLSTGIIDKFYMNFKRNYVSYTYEQKRNLEVLHILFCIPLYKACCFGSLPERNEMEISTKDFTFIPPLILRGGMVTEESYGDTNFITAVQKIISKVGTNGTFDDRDKEEEIISDILLYHKFAIDFTKRKDQLKDRLAYNAIRSSSRFIKDTNVNILDQIGVGLREAYGGITLECTIEKLDNKDVFPTTHYLQYNFDSDKYQSLIKRLDMVAPAVESFFKNNKHKLPSLPDDHDIDILYVEFDRMSCQSDRTYVLDLIYNLIEKINSTMEFYHENDETKAKRIELIAKQKLARLDELRNMVLKKRSFDSHYSVFVKSPEGYEG